jgi:hypothetical protein
MKKFNSVIEIIGINPYVIPPEEVLTYIFRQAKKEKGPIPVKGKLNGHPFIQTLVKYAGKWRLYLNTPMRNAAGIDVGDNANVEIEFDPQERVIEMHPDLVRALEQNPSAKKAFKLCPPSRQKEIIRYINSLKSEASRVKNINRAIGFLKGEERFIGREKP